MTPLTFNSIFNSRIEFYGPLYSIQFKFYRAVAGEHRRYGRIVWNACVFSCLLFIGIMAFFTYNLRNTLSTLHFFASFLFWRENIVNQISPFLNFHNKIINFDRHSKLPTFHWKRSILKSKEFAMSSEWPNMWYNWADNNFITKKNKN